MRVGAAQNLGVKHAGKFYIDAKFLPAQNLGLRIAPENTLPDHRELCHFEVPLDTRSNKYTAIVVTLLALIRQQLRLKAALTPKKIFRF
jgi:hypothetical protein